MLELPSTADAHSFGDFAGRRSATSTASDTMPATKEIANDARYSKGELFWFK
jgi:hypothetical protein